MRFASLFFFSLLTLGCKSDFLDKEPVGPTTFNVLSNTLKGADALLVGAYSPLDGFVGYDVSSPWASAGSNWLYGSVVGGDAYRGSEPGDQTPMVDFESHQARPTNEFLAQRWHLLYEGVSRSNLALQAFQQLSDAEPLRDIRMGEARMLRAHYHFEAKKMWNNVPWIDETVTDFRVPNNVDIWPLIEADLQAAADVLPWVQPEIGRVTKGGALALLGKAYLFQHKYAEARTAFNQVISSGQYSLVASYHDNFRIATRNNPECVWAVQQAVNVPDATEDDNGNAGDVLNFPYSGGPSGCCGFHQPSQNLVNAFKTNELGLPLLDTYNDADVTSDQGLLSSQPFTPYTGHLDPRLDWTVGRRDIPFLDWGPHPGNNWIRNQIYGGPYSPKKNTFYQSEQGIGSNASGWTKGYTAHTLKLIRYADVLLMAAECEVELGNLEQARTYVNLVRERAANPAGWVLNESGLPAANYLVSTYPTLWTDATEARKAVRFERRLELGMEGHRFFDLVRWGIAAQERNYYFNTEGTKRFHLANASFAAGTHEYFPIPQRAIDASVKDGVPTLVQNPGY